MKKTTGIQSEGLTLLEEYCQDSHSGMNLFSALVESLNEEEIYILLTDDTIDRRLKDKVRARVAGDLRHKNCPHTKIINLWKSQACSSDPIVKRNGSANLMHVIPFVDRDFSSIIISFLIDESPLIRRRGKNLIPHIRNKYKQALIEGLEKAWVSYEDYFLSKQVCETAREKFLYEHYRELWDPSTAKLIFDRLWRAGYNILEDLKRESPRDYLYFCAITQSDISDDEVMNILYENKAWEKFPLLLWSVGYMKKYNVLRKLMAPEWMEWFEKGYYESRKEMFMAGIEDPAEE